MTTMAGKEMNIPIRINVACHVSEDQATNRSPRFAQCRAAANTIDPIESASHSSVPKCAKIPSPT